VSKAEYPGQDALVYFALVPASLKNLKVHLDTQFCFSSIMAEIEILGLFFCSVQISYRSGEISPFRSKMDEITRAE